MSLGWQTESALLPSKSKQINNVDDKSMVGLKALIYSEENKRTGDKVNRKAVNRKRKESEGKDSQSKSSGNKRVATDDHDNKQSKVFQSLNAKSKLYNDLMSGSSTVDGAASLIDFDNKRDDHKRHAIESEIDHRGAYGGPPTVSASVCVPSSICSASSSSSQWVWSKGSKTENGGHDEDFYITSKCQERLLSQQIEEKIAIEMQQSGQSGQSGQSAVFSQRPVSMGQYASNDISSHAKVKTQWEKTLNSSAKNYLEDVHSATMRIRGSAHTNANGGSSNDGVGDGGRKLSAKEERIAMLRRKQAEKRQHKQ